ncbi:serine/threonine-protein kinase [Pullulanibacillus pueri]|uniref:non-specific serine/threonine protein kinase n=1 Tax=Pullulanibacillus pueri TaxID=1437324 RepID=A0A8J3ELS1_9BACL|nr:serine/threonine-protein kinase [Pullulanibacillus pueri]MBM7681329.1 serine/threonine-protein kinase [Pullulanibacillus pueri]GGH77567.1 hypothetical protein GCM10007096_09650 [Pullulanibacillus pueri]
MGRVEGQRQAKEPLNGRYNIIKIIGSGGMSTVYLVEDSESDGKRWAIKASSVAAKGYNQLKGEAQILSELNHPHLPLIVDYFSSEDHRYFYLVQEYIEGKTLLQLHEESQEGLDYKDIVHYCLQISGVLDYLHRKKVIYKDLKPGNVMVTNTGEVKLIDFGTSRKFDERKLADTLQLGTVGFAAPEQFEKQQTDHRTDLFSLGAMMYFLLSNGKYVYTTQKPLNTLHRHLPKSLVSLVHDLIQLEPSRRCQTAKEVQERLKAIEEEKPKLLNKRLFVEYSLSLLWLMGVLVYILMNRT